MGVSAFSQEWEWRNYIGYEYKAYVINEDDSRNFNSAATFQNELKYALETFKFYSKIDVLYDGAEKERNYFDVKEAYVTRAFEDFDLFAGKRVFFLGSLEAFNPTDMLNRQNYRKDTLSTHKEGIYSAGINYYLPNDTRVDLTVSYEDRTLPLGAEDSPYYPFRDAHYRDDVLFLGGSQQPSWIATFSQSFDDLLRGDTSIGVFYGYDDHTLFISDADTYRPTYFQSAKVFTYDTLVVDAMLYKLEAAYTRVAEESLRIDHFYEIGIGVEYTIEQIIGNHNLGLLAEYYRSDTTLSAYDNDLFLGIRYALNDKDSSEFVGGVLKSMDDEGMGAYLKYEGRLNDALKLSADVRYLKHENYLNEHLRIGCEIKYYF